MPEKPDCKEPACSARYDCPKDCPMVLVGTVELVDRDGKVRELLLAETEVNHLKWRSRAS